MLSTRLSSDQRAKFASDGWLLVDDLLPCTVEELQAEVDRIASWSDEGAWLHHREMTDFGPKLARTENFVPFSATMRQLLESSAISDVAGELLGEEALLYKEKINYKFVGGAGFRPHQDQPAYPMVRRVLSVMIAIDDATIENGCLYVASGHHHAELAMDDRGCLTDQVVASLTWEPAELRAGQTLFFHGWTPHRSGPNHSTTDRRALYPTYNGRSEGRRREAYYDAKRAAFADAEPTDRVRLSLIGDFEGRPV